MKSKMNFGDSLSGMLINKNIGVKEFAQHLNISCATVYQWKLNRHEPNLTHLIMMAEFFNCSLEFLVGNSDDDTLHFRKERKPFPLRIREIMKEKGISSYKMRKTTRFNGGHFRKWDKGASPILSTLADLAEYFDCTLDNLVGWE